MFEDLFSRIVGPFVRHALNAIFGYFVLKGFYSGDEGSKLVEDIAVPLIGFLGTLLYSIWQKYNIGKLLTAALAAAPGTHPDAIKARAGVPKFVAVFLLATFAVAGQVACAGVKAPPQLSPVGDIAWYDHKVNVATNELQEAVIQATAQGLISVDVRKQVGRVTEKIGDASLDLNKALRSGEGIADAKTKAITIIEAALQEVPHNLPQNIQAIVQGYVDVITNVLEWLKSVSTTELQATYRLPHAA